MNFKLLLLLNLLGLVCAHTFAQHPAPIDTDLLAATLGPFFKAKNPHPDDWWVNAETASVRYEPGLGLVVSTPAFRASPLASARVKSGDKIVIDNRNVGSVPATTPELIQGLITDWLVAYGVQARDLPANEKVVVTYKAAGYYFGQGSEPAMFTFSNGTPTHSEFQSLRGSVAMMGPADPADSLRVRELTMEVRVSALRDLKTGKINEQAFRSLATVIHVRTMTDKAPQDSLEEQVFKGMLRKLAVGLYGPEPLAMTWETGSWNHRSAHITGSYASGTGYAFRMEMQSAQVQLLGLNSARSRERLRVEVTGDPSGLAEPDDPAAPDWAQFKERLAQAILDYGPTLKRLAPGERLQVRVSRPLNAGPNWPETAVVSISQKDLSLWDRRSISRAEALKAILWGE